MGRIKDWTGQQINYWTVIEAAPKDYAVQHNIKDQHQFWKCQCICGNISYISSKHLSSGQAKSCGCMRQNKSFLAGKTFGRITIINENQDATKQHREINPNNRDIYWNCHCNFCNNDFITNTSIIKMAGVNATCPQCRKVKDIRGQKNGKLTVIDFIGINNKKEEHNSAIWLCQCECGKQIELPTPLTKLVYSCGCMKESIGEHNIKQILDDNKIKYIYNRPYFKDLLSVNKYVCRYDFILLDKNEKPYRIIEFDGIQHTNINADWYTETQAQNDIIKNQYAWNHNIPIVRIPYNMKNKITLDILLGDTYCVKPE